MLEEIKARMLIQALLITGDNKPLAASVLGISLKTVYNMINRYEGSNYLLKENDWIDQHLARLLRGPKDGTTQELPETTSTGE